MAIKHLLTPPSPCFPTPSKPFQEAGTSEERCRRFKDQANLAGWALVQLTFLLLSTITSVAAPEAYIEGDKLADRVIHLVGQLGVQVPAGIIVNYVRQLGAALKKRPDSNGRARIYGAAISYTLESANAAVSLLRPMLLEKTGEATIPGVALLRTFELFAERPDFVALSTAGLRRIETFGTDLAQAAGEVWRARPAGAQCPICTEVIPEGEVAIVTGCRGVHHASCHGCLEKLRQAGGLYRCPFCRATGQLHRVLLPTSGKEC